MVVDRVAAFHEILAQNPQDSFARYGLAMEHRQRGETAPAMEQFEELKRLHPDYIPAYQMAAQMLIAEGKAEEATERLRLGIVAARRVKNQHALAEMEGMLEELEEQGR